MGRTGTESLARGFSEKAEGARLETAPTVWPKVRLPVPGSGPEWDNGNVPTHGDKNADNACET